MDSNGSRGTGPNDDDDDDGVACHNRRAFCAAAAAEACCLACSDANGLEGIDAARAEADGDLSLDCDSA